MFKWLSKIFCKKNNNISQVIERSIFDQQIKNKFLANNIDQEFLQSLEVNLIKADIGVTQTQHLITLLQEQKFTKETSLDDLKKILNNEIIKLLSPYEKKLELNHKPTVILFNGVNGSGKTTSLGKLAYYFTQKQKKILIAACDTFRAAAVGQLDNWGQASRL